MSSLTILRPLRYEYRSFSDSVYTFLLRFSSFTILFICGHNFDAFCNTVTSLLHVSSVALLILLLKILNPSAAPVLTIRCSNVHIRCSNPLIMIKLLIFVTFVTFFQIKICWQ